MHRIEIEQTADHHLGTHIAQRLRAFVFISHHRTYRLALFQQQFGDRAPYPADAASRAGDQNGICHIFPFALPESSQIRECASTSESLSLKMT